MKKVINKIIGITTTLAICFAFVVSVNALADSTGSKSWTIGTSATLTSSGSMSKSYKTVISATSGSGTSNMYSPRISI